MKSRMDCSQLPAYIADRLLLLQDPEKINAELEKLNPITRGQVRTQLRREDLREKREIRLAQNRPTPGRYRR